MTPSTRKLVGSLALLVFLVIYVFLAMAAAIVLQVNASKATELVFHLIAGTLWLPAAFWLISWMYRADGSKTKLKN